MLDLMVCNSLQRYSLFRGMKSKFNKYFLYTLSDFNMVDNYVDIMFILCV